jgi:hypothetical protein
MLKLGINMYKMVRIQNNERYPIQWLLLLGLCIVHYVVYIHCLLLEHLFLPSLSRKRNIYIYYLKFGAI